MTDCDRDTVVVGGGIIGIACAHYLSEAGHRVTVIDKARIGEACSHRNCGFVCPSHVLPLAEPGAIRSALAAMWKAGGAFRIRPRLDPALWAWLWNFARRCNHGKMLESGRAIQPLLRTSYSLYSKLMEDADFDCEWQTRGLLFVYKSKKALEAYKSVSNLLAAEFDEAPRLLGPHELLEFEPSLGEGVAGAWHFEHDAHLRPERLLTSWRAKLERRGVRFLENMRLDSFEESGGRVRSAMASGSALRANHFVIATGAWTPKLEEILRVRVPIEPGKGYSVMIPRSEHSPSIPMIFPEHRVGVTPLEAGIRLGSIMEFSGYDETISDKRLAILSEGASHYLRDPISTVTTDHWYGWRPMTYDSTPVIGQMPGFSNVFLATGHNMLGLSMAPATGRLIAELIENTETHIAPEPYRVERFLR